MRRAKIALLLLLSGLWTVEGWSAEVKVSQQRRTGTESVRLAEDVVVTAGTPFRTVQAPLVDGWRFIRWDVTQGAPADFAVRDPWGRALDAATCIPVDAQTTLTALYDSAGEDKDGDLIPDADEKYWYGATSHGATSDTDQDGYDFSQELRFALNPLFPNRLASGGVAAGNSTTILYNPNGYAPYVVRSEPEGLLFASRTEYAAPGDIVTTEPYDPRTTPFAYWTVDGIRSIDAFGVSCDRATFTTTGRRMEIIAHCVNDETARLSLYWYGRTGVTADTDGDGYAFAQELRYALNPRMVNALKAGGVASGTSATIWYNPNGYSPYVIEASPTNRFPSRTGFLREGESLTTETELVSSPEFAYWTRNGKRQADRLGRALDQVTLVGTGNADDDIVLTAHFITNRVLRDAMYWYGDPAASPDGDTDGDGYTFAEEMRLAMNPLLKNKLLAGGVVAGSSETIEANIQVFDRHRKILLDGVVSNLFADVGSILSRPDVSAWDGTYVDLKGGQSFGGDLAVAVVDTDGDGLFDVIVATKSTSGVTLTRYHNIGGHGAPNFTVEPDAYPALAKVLSTYARPLLYGGLFEGKPVLWFSDDVGKVSRFDLATSAISATPWTGFPVWSAETGAGVFTKGSNVVLADGVTLACDVPVTDPVSASLAEATGDERTDLLVADRAGRISLYERTAAGFTLRHRIWGGTFVGFAEGLTLAPVDWDGDGDLDMLCGTKNGKLLLLSDPNVGHPVNLTAVAGYDNVLLGWDPNGQSRVYGYRVYRSKAADFGPIGDTALPSYRDVPPSISEWSYRVTALSRLWRAGYSTPDLFESPASEVRTVDLGSIGLSIPDRSAFSGWEVAVPVSVDNTHGLSAKEIALTMAYDPAKLAPVAYGASPLLPTNMVFSETFGTMTTNGAKLATWTIRTTSTAETVSTGAGEFLSYIFKVKATASGDTPVLLTEATFATAAGQPIATRPALPLTSTITLQVLQPIEVTLEMDDLSAKAGESIAVPVEIKGESIDWSTLKLEATYDHDKLTQTGFVAPTKANPKAIYTFRVAGLRGENLRTQLEVTGSAKGMNGAAASVTPARSFVFIEAIRQPDKPVEASVKLVVTDIVLVPDEDDVNAGDGTGYDFENVTIKVRVESTVALDWESIRVRAICDEEALEIEKYKPPTAKNPVAVFHFDVEDKLENELTAQVVFTAKVKRADGRSIEVAPATCTVSLIGTDPKEPDKPDLEKVEPWTNGDCDGDGKLTFRDYLVAKATARWHHFTAHSPKHTADGKDRKVHASICQALGRASDAKLRFYEIPTLFKRYLWSRGVRPNDWDLENALDDWKEKWDKNDED